jgi:hypothetical protein
VQRYEYFFILAKGWEKNIGIYINNVMGNAASFGAGKQAESFDRRLVVERV